MEGDGGIARNRITLLHSSFNSGKILFGIGSPTYFLGTSSQFNSLHMFGFSTNFF